MHTCAWDPSPIQKNICWPGAFLHHQLLVATSGRRANPTPFRPAQTPQNPRPPKNSQPSSNPWSPGKIVGHHQGIVYNFQFQRLGDYHHIKSVSRPPLNFLDATMHLDYGFKSLPSKNIKDKVWRQNTKWTFTGPCHYDTLLSALWFHFWTMHCNVMQTNKPAQTIFWGPDHGS